MPTSKLDPQPAASNLPAGDCWEAPDHTEKLFTASGPLPAPARRFGITDPQQWIDLCG